MAENFQAQKIHFEYVYFMKQTILVFYLKYFSEQNMFSFSLPLELSI